MPGPAVVNTRDLLDGFGRLGVHQGAFVEVHASMSSFGFVDGGEATVIAAQIDAVGPRGAVVMPAAQASRAIPLTPEERERGLTWKVRVLGADDLTTPTFQGRVADRFRTWPGVERDSYTAWGAHAEEFCHGLTAFAAAGGRCVLLGVGLNRASCLHAGDSRVQTPADIRALFTPPETVKRDYPSDTWWIGYDVRRPGKDVDRNGLLETAADQRGLLTKTLIGDANTMAFEAKTLVDLSVKLRQEELYRMRGLAPPSDPSNEAVTE